ncbi:MAG: SEC-C domain-containing protein, partial [Kiritimatiellae bacterium]|nr:SEC-C domain-containing protein [Kiritimatiellia bacterium]
GRGTDIKLGERVVYLPKSVIESRLTLHDKLDGTSLRAQLLEKPCGLHVIGSERHESRRIDRQLRGRCARQGDPGSSRFYVSLEDDLMRLFGSDRISGIMGRLGIEEGQQLEHPWLNRSIETAQRRVEQHNYSIRRRTLEYDDVMNKQREIIYGFRGDIVKGEQVREHLYDLVADVIEMQAQEAFSDGKIELMDNFVTWVNATFPVGFKREELTGEGLDAETASAKVFERVKRAYELKVQIEDPAMLPGMERFILLHAIDTHWQDYLRAMDYLRQSVGLRAYGQQDPLVEYKREAYSMFSSLMDTIKSEVVTRIFRSTTSLQGYERLVASMPVRLVHNEVATLGGGAGGQMTDDRRPGSAGAFRPGEQRTDGESGTLHREGAKVGRNDPCPCKSGKKFKKCCGRT